ncbi:MAG TPA: mechanosensitive ion channel domain-containing protein [Acidobacteriaceae bacterium]|nr:mechanosensitive ion channel domain-containing protein [Acidobacteriaceae bacterium]
MPEHPIVEGSAPRPPLLGRIRTVLIIVLAAVLAICVVFSWVTSGAMNDLAFMRARRGAANQSLVDLRPWQTAHTLASMAATSEEAEYAQEAERLADHEVDQAFAAALREAELKTRHQVLTGRSLALSKRITELKQEITEDQSEIEALKASSAAPTSTAKSVARSAAGSDALQVAEAQLGLDSDELTDTQRDLSRATGNLSVRIQEELAAHEAQMRKYDSEQENGAPLAIVSAQRHGTLAGRLKAWFDQRSRYALIEQALAEAQNDTQMLIAKHNALEAKANASDATATGSESTLAGIQDSSIEREILANYDDRIQTNQQLARVYGKWANQVLLQHQVILHLIMQSLEAIVFIALCLILGDAVVHHLMARESLDRRRTETLRTIFEVGVQAVGLLLIALVIFGPPHETGTMIGLATAALAIALQDYILAFLGWFMLAGKNGIRVGDMVEIDGVCGEVIEVGLLSTTLLETTGLAEKGEPTGRRVSLLNSYAIHGKCFNFSSEGQWLWDEIRISVPAGEDVFAIAKSVEMAAREETKESARLAEKEWKQTAQATGLTRMSAEPIVMLRPSVPLVDIATGVDIQVRYVTRASGRFEVRDRLYKHVIRLLQEKKRSARPRLTDTSGGEAKVAGAQS